MRYDPQNPRLPGANVFVLPKGHAAPLLYAAWAEAGAMPRERLLALRKIGSDLEGHPTPRLPFVDVATGSLGQGLSAGVGIAYDSAKLRPSSQPYMCSWATENLPKDLFGRLRSGLRSAV
jgi:transketolase